MKDYESLFVKRLAEQLSNQRETVSAKDSLLVRLKREMMSKETSDIRKLRAENDLRCLKITGYKQKITEMTEESTKNAMKMALFEAERKDQNEIHLKELKVKSQGIENLLGEKATILLEKDGVQSQLVVLENESSLRKVRIENLVLAIDEPFDDVSNQEESDDHRRGDIDDTEDGTDDYRSSAGPSWVVDHQYSQERSSPRLRRILPKLAVTRPQEHVQESPSLEIGLHPCLICRKTFPQAYRLKRHIREVHDKEKLYRCNDCDKEFFKSTSLIRHKISLHEKVRPFGCPNCESRFKDRSALKYHTRKKVCSAKAVRT